MTKQSLDLAELQEKLLEDNPTPLLASTATQLVFGSGNPAAEIMFVGEAPGKNEDLKGEPFVGAAGKFLDEMLASVNVERSDVYITNIVKYRPPENRDPSPEEKAEFWPYLVEQINIIKPKIVVTLGRHSGQAFIQSLHISVDHGKPRRVRLVRHDHAGEVQGDGEKRTETYKSTAKGASRSATQQFAANLGSADSSGSGQDEMVIVVLPLYHPAAALYNGSLRQTLLDDFRIVNRLLISNI